MHLRSYPKLLRSELHLDATGVPAPSQRSQQEALMRRMSSKQSHISTSRIPLAFISTNTLCYSASGTSLQLPLPAASRYCVPPEPCRSAAEDADVPPNVWTVIRPGHVREKIAMFASEGTRTNETDGGPTACTDAGAPTGPLRAAKAKGSWEENSAAKRRRRSSNNRNQSEQQQRKLKAKPRSAEPPGGGQAAAEEQQKISVVEMVAFLELRARQLQPSLKPLLNLQRSSTTITLSKTAPPELREGEEPEVVRVSEMVARLESERLRSAEAGLSRSNSLKRRVGRVLLAAGRRSPAPAAPSHTPAPPDAQSGSDDPVRAEPPPTGKPEEEEPQPGLLFLSADRPESQPRPPHYRTSFYLEPALPGTSQQPEKAGGSPPLGRSASASQDFLRVRQRLQRLLAPQSYLLLLPHHLLVKLLLLLPTHSLAALKCSCSYFKFVIENYGVRPADSLWVSDPRYRDDPCKQCKRRYRPGDVSLCRWHHKPYCQALPYGPGYWMCCHGAQRDAPGCNVGLHDNRWVPAFHSINAPIYRRNYIREGGVV